MIELTEEEKYKHHISKRYFICKGKFNENNEYDDDDDDVDDNDDDDDDDKKSNYIKVRDHCHYTRKYRGSAHKICNLRYNDSNEIRVVFHNGASYDYHFIIKGLAKEFKGDFKCLGENKEKYITFSVPIKKEYNEDEDKTIIYRIKFIDSFRFVSTSLSNLVDNLSGGIHDNGKCRSCNSFSLEYISLSNNDRLLFECFNCQKRFSRKFDIAKKIKSTYNFCNGDIEKKRCLPL